MLRQRIVLLENALELERLTVEQQRADLDALGARIETLQAQLHASEARSEEIARSGAVRDTRAEALEGRLAELEGALEGEGLVERVAELLARRVGGRGDGRSDGFDEGGSPELARQLHHLDERLRGLEQGSTEARLRMRLDRQGHRIDELERRVPALEGSERATTETLTALVEGRGRQEARLARLESLFDELADEVREDREALDLAGLRARLDDLETLVLQTGFEEDAFRKRLGEHERTLGALRETVEQVERVTLAPPSTSSTEGDDLTQIKGIGPKYARLLRELGVTSFAALAAWTDEDVERAATHLGIPPARIRKAGWVDAAAHRAQDAGP